MQIIIVGCGNVGRTLTEQLSQEGHNVTVIDIRPELVQTISDTYDVLGVEGNGASYKVLIEAGIESANLLIAVAGSDELNLLCCVIAKKAGNCQTIARVGNPVYQSEMDFIRKEMGISMIVNPELAAALEIGRLIKYPLALEVDSFAKEEIELMKLVVGADSKLCNCCLKNIKAKTGVDLLVCMVERGEDVIIPDGNFTLREKDVISIVTSSKEAQTYLRKMNFFSKRVRNVMIVGGGETTVYVANQLLEMGIHVKIIEMDKERCKELCELVPQAAVICGDGTDRELLIEEEAETMGAFVSWTNFDEENVMLALFVKSISHAKLITRIHRVNYDQIIKNLEIGSVLYPKNITSEYILRYVRAMQNSIGSNVETLYRLIENKVEALEFLVKEDATNITDKPLSVLDLRDDVIICGIWHKGKLITPKGNDVIRSGDSVVVVTTALGLRNLNDILKVNL